MSKVKKILAVALAVVMAMALAVPALADGETGGESGETETHQLKITSARNGETYKLYRILDATHADNTTNYAYTIRTDNGSVYLGYFMGKVTTEKNEDVETYKLGSIVLADQTTGIPTSHEVYKYIKSFDGNEAVFAQDLGAWIVNQGSTLNADATVTVGNPTDNPEDSDPAVGYADGLAYGYYLLMPQKAFEADGLGAVLFSLETVTKSVTINSKTKYPVPTKTVGESGTAKTNVAAVGDDVKFTISGLIPDNIEDFSSSDLYHYTFHDEMNGMEYKKDSVSIKLTKESLAEKTLILPADAIKWDAEHGKLDVKVGPELYTVIEENSEYIGGNVVLTYTATINNTILTNHYGDNKVRIEYSTTPGVDDTQTSKEDKTRTYSVNLELNKFDNSDIPQRLAGSQWKLEVADNSVPSGFRDITNQFTKAKVVDSGEGGTTTQDVIILTDESASTFFLQGLKLTTYKLTEVSPPPGFNALSKPIEFTLTATVPTDPTATNLSAFIIQFIRPPAMVSAGTHNADTFTYVMNVNNDSHGKLPSTGGAGLYIVAGVAIVALLGFGGTAMLKRKVNGGE